MTDKDIAELRTQSARLEERMSARQAEYDTGLAAMRADIGEFRADLTQIVAENKTEIAAIRVELTQIAAKSETGLADIRADFAEFGADIRAGIGDLKTELARRETRMMFGALAIAGIAIAVLGVFIALD